MREDRAAEHCIDAEQAFLNYMCAQAEEKGSKKAVSLPKSMQTILPLNDLIDLSEAEHSDDWGKTGEKEASGDVVPETAQHKSQALLGN